jgi:hypothetical protein
LLLDEGLTLSGVVDGFRSCVMTQKSRSINNGECETSEALNGDALALGNNDGNFVVVMVCIIADIADELRAERNASAVRIAKSFVLHCLMFVIRIIASVTYTKTSFNLLRA